MAETITFTEEEVGQINQLRQEVANVFTQLGQLSVQKRQQMDNFTNMENQLLQKQQELQQHEQELFKGLNDKYGDGNYDPATNTFIPTPQNESTES